MSILIFGDAFVDVWMTARKRKTLSAEQLGLPIYDIQSSRRQPGGADNVAENIASLDPSLSVVHAYNVDNIPVKSRITVEGTQVCRFDANDSCPAVMPSRYAIKGNIVVISDYDKGSITNGIAQEIYTAKPSAIWINSKRPQSNLACLDMQGQGSKGPAKDRPVIKRVCNQSEYDEAQDFYEDQEEVYVTLGSKGIVKATKINESWLSQSQSAFASNVVSVCGAGDTTLAALVTCPWGWNELMWAMCAAAIAVEQPRTSVVTYDQCVARYHDECRGRSLVSVN